MIREPAEIGRGLAPAREPRPIPRGERIHIVGAAGAGASAAVLLAHYAGAAVTGCDPGGSSPYTRPAEEIGISLAWRHDPRHVSLQGRALVERVGVTKALTAIEPDHPELQAARDAGVPLEAWQQVVADAAATHGGHLVAIAGTHGKSTVSGWLVHLLAGADRDPAAFVGALLPAELTNGISATARWGSGDVFVVEADEYAANFDAYQPSVAVMLNAEWDHPDVFVDETGVIDAFERWIRAGNDAARRTLVAEVGNPGVARLVERLADWTGKIVTFRLADESQRTSKKVDVEARLETPSRTLSIDLGALGAARVSAKVPLPGRHNAANAVAVAVAAAVLGANATAIAKGIESFHGVGRRFELKGEPRGIAVLDDYGHHPTAIAASMAAVRERYPGRRLWAVYEPLTFHRTAAMLDHFADVLAKADRVAIAEIWAGRDPDRSIVSAADLAGAVNQRDGARAEAPGSIESTADYLADQVESGDVVLVMGGGRSYVIADKLVELLESRG